MNDASEPVRRDIPGHEGAYQVSSDGRVFSSLRISQGYELSLSINPRTGYRMVNVGGRTRSVHELVALAFIGPRPDRMQICHNNGNPIDNRVENLRYGTSSENHYDSIAHGTHWPSVKTHCKQGHEFSPENTKVTTSSGKTQRRCIACTRIAGRKASAAYRRRRAG